MPVDFYASLTHYADHLDAVADALGDQVGHRWYRFPGAFGPRWSQLPDRWSYDDGAPVVVASWVDARHIATAGRPVIYLEHGAGQTYPGDPASADHPSYAGGADHQAVLYLCPSERVADRWRARYPRARVAVVGCPKLDPWHAVPFVPQVGSLTVALTFHWDCTLVPETRWALPHYDGHLAAVVQGLADQGVRVIGHGHPRAVGKLRQVWDRVGIEHVADLGDVMDQAHVLVGDNTSALYEFASLDRPVVVLNAPWYRRHVHHGLRFWDLVPGVQVDHPDDLLAAIRDALGPDSGRASRQAAVDVVYAARDGHAAARAAAAIEETRQWLTKSRPMPTTSSDA